MKGSRQNAILEIIEAAPVETQDEIAKQLALRGFHTTQATISRDIKEMHLIKIQSEDGSYRYTVNEVNSNVNTDRLLRVFRETVVSIQEAASIVVVNTLSGSANAAAEVLDNMEIDGIVGSLAGDNTIFVATKDISSAHTVAHKLRQFLR